MSDQCAETPLSDHVARFWTHLETETVRIVVDLKRTAGTEAPDGAVVYWDGATFSDAVAKGLVAERQADHARANAYITQLECEIDRLNRILAATRELLGATEAELREARA